MDEDEGLGRLRRPRPVPLAGILGKHDHLPTPRATLAVALAMSMLQVEDRLKNVVPSNLNSHAPDKQQ